MSSSLGYAVLVVACGAFIGWVTNCLTIAMILGPYERVRIIGPLGWQGTLVRHADRFARELADMIVEGFFRPRDLAVQVDPTAIHRALRPFAKRTIDAAIARFRARLPPAMEGSPLLSAEVFAELRQQLLFEVEGLGFSVRELALARMEPLVDPRAEIVRNLTGTHVGRLEDFFVTVVGKELRQIERYGGIFGALFGLVQIGLLGSGPTTLWVIPVVGILIGAVTNRIAIWMIFAPRDPVRFGPLVLHGSFPRRREEIACGLATAVGRELKLGAVLDVMIANGFGRELREFVRARLVTFLAPRLAPLATILAYDGVVLSAEAIANDVLEELGRDTALAFAMVKALAERQIDIVAIVRSKLESLETLRFEEVVRALVRQDERVLTACRGLLGGAIGVAEMALVAALR